MPHACVDRECQPGKLGLVSRCSDISLRDWRTPEACAPSQTCVFTRPYSLPLPTTSRRRGPHLAVVADVFQTRWAPCLRPKTRRAATASLGGHRSQCIVRQPPTESGRWDSNPRRPAWEGGGKTSAECSTRQFSSEDAMLGATFARHFSPNSASNGSRNGSHVATYPALKPPVPRVYRSDTTNLCASAPTRPVSRALPA